VEATRGSSSSSPANVFSPIPSADRALLVSPRPRSRDSLALGAHTFPYAPWAAGAASVRQGRGWTKGRAETKSTKSSSNSRHADAERSPRAESALARLLSPSFSLFVAASRVVLLRPPSADVRRLSRVFPENRVPRACPSRGSRKNLLALAARDPSHARVAPN